MEYNFQAAKVRDACIEWLKQYGKGSGLSKVVLGISGGKDSSIVAALCCRAFGKENVFGLLMPNGNQHDIHDSYEICEALGIDYRVMNIKEIYDAEIKALEATGDIISEEAKINIAPRIRMTTMYAWGQSNHSRVCGTSNLSEITLGYFTKYGDGGSDFNPISMLTSLEVIAIGNTLIELPYYLVNKKPNDGLSGMDDEEKLGLKYEDVHKYIRNIDGIDAIDLEKIKRLENYGSHKRNNIPTYMVDKELIFTD